MSDPIRTIDLGQRSVEDTYLDPIIALAFEVRVRTTDLVRMTELLVEAERDLAELRDAGLLDFYEDAEHVLSRWEERAEQVGLRGYAFDGWYYIEPVPTEAEANA